MNHIFILDWDDTLFPTNVIINNKINPQDYNSIIEWTTKLIPFDKLVTNYVRNLKKNGKVIIITNASIQWIQMTSVLLPQLSQIIQNDVEIISARDQYSQMYTDIFEWKKQAFLKTFTTIYNSTQNLHIYSIGDAQYERIALINLNAMYKDHNNIVFKNIKLIDKPSVEQMMDQFNVLNDSMNSIINYKLHLDLNFHNLNNI